MEANSDKESNGRIFHPIRRNDSIPKNSETNKLEITKIEIDKLVQFNDHPFKLYEGQRFTDMVESIRANGVLVPIIVRPHGEEAGKYEILSGHNRVAAAREAGIEYIPAIIRKGLTDDEALLIVTETNFIQRSFADLKHSEKAFTLTVHYNAMKKKAGYRTDLLYEIEKLTCAPLGHGMRTRDKMGEQYSLVKTTVARYLRINQLISSLKDWLDNEKIGMRVAEALSYLRVTEQEIVEKLLAKGTKISIKQADTLKAESEKNPIDSAKISELLNSNCCPVKFNPITLNGQLLAQHFNPGQSAEEIEKVIILALDQYFKNQNS